MRWLFLVVAVFLSAAEPDLNSSKAFVDSAIRHMDENLTVALHDFTYSDKWRIGNRYIFVYQFGTGECKANGQTRELVGMFLYNLRDKKGNFVVIELEKAAKRGGGYTCYVWTDPESNELRDKRGFSKAFNSHLWVGTGEYVQHCD